MSKGLPNEYLASLSERIIAARKEKLRGMLPSAVEVVGKDYDGWWDNEKHAGRPEWHLWGPRYHVTMSASMGGITDTGSELVLKFTITHTKVITGEEFVEPDCPACAAGED